MIACYIIYSQHADKFYIGFTQENVESRIARHNDATYGTHYTSYTNDWKVFLVISCVSVGQAMKIEKHIKKMKSRTYIQNLKAFPEISEKLKKKFPD